MDTNIEFEYEEKRPQEAKTRSCLMCREEFPSSGPGERVCKRCRSSSVWRHG